MPEATAPAPAPPPPPAQPAAPAPSAPATSDAVIVFSNIPSAHCDACESVKITVTPAGEVLVERGFWTGGHRAWHYKRAMHHVGQARSAAFAASLSTDRPAGDQTLPGNAQCRTVGDGLAVEWIEGDRHDHLTVTSTCAAGGDSEAAARLRQAPALLGLRSDLLGQHETVFPWGDGTPAR